MGASDPKKHRNQDRKRRVLPVRDAVVGRARSWACLLRCRCDTLPRPVLANVFRHLPPPEGHPIRLRFRPGLTASRGRLVSGRKRGTAVHAGAFIRRRELVLDSSLTGRPSELARILIHEIFHFAWVRLGNARRRSFEELVGHELRQGVRGELGWSSELRKNRLRPADMRDRSRRWREYVCESFCDTAAWRFADLRAHAEFTLDRVSRTRRRRWLRHAGLESSIPI